MKIRVYLEEKVLKEYDVSTYSITQRQIMDDLYDTAGLNPLTYPVLCTKKEGQLSALTIDYDMPLGLGLELFLGDYSSQNLRCYWQSDNFPLSFTPAHIISKYPELANAVCYSGAVNIFAPENRNKTLWQLGIPPDLDITYLVSISNPLASAPPLDEESTDQEDERITIYVHSDNNLPSPEEILKTKTVGEFILERSGSPSIDEWKQLGMQYYYDAPYWYWSVNGNKEGTKETELVTQENWNRTFADIFPGQREICISLIVAQDRSADEIYEGAVNKSSDNYNEHMFTGSLGTAWSTTTKYVAGGAAAGFAVAIVAEGTIGILVACEEQYTIAAIISPLAQVDMCMPYVSAALGIVVLTALGALIGWAIAPEMPKNAQHYQEITSNR